MAAELMAAEATVATVGGDTVADTALTARSVVGHAAAVFIQQPELVSDGPIPKNPKVPL